MSRIAEPVRDALGEAQRQAYDAIVDGARGEMAALFWPWLSSPELCDRAQALGEFVRYKTSLPPRLSELAILVTARFWKSNFEWVSHEPIARETGLAPDIIEAVKSGTPPSFAKSDEETVYRLSRELHERHVVTDATYRDSVERFGEGGTAELVCLLGYYTMAAMTLSAFRLPLPEGADAPFGEPV